MKSNGVVMMRNTIAFALFLALFSLCIREILYQMYIKTL